MHTPPVSPYRQRNRVARRILAAFCAAVALASCAARPSSGGEGRGSAEQILAALEHRVEDATRRGDVVFLDSIYAPSFRFTHSTGELEERAQRLDGLRRGTARVFARDLDSLDVEVHDDVALTTGRIHVRQESESPEWREYTVRYARVYVRRSGRWLLLTHRTTALTHGPLHDPDPAGSPR
jgi:hypothetical protein